MKVSKGTHEDDPALDARASYDALSSLQPPVPLSWATRHGEEASLTSTSSTLNLSLRPRQPLTTMVKVKRAMSHDEVWCLMMRCDIKRISW